MPALPAALYLFLGILGIALAACLAYVVRYWVRKTRALAAAPPSEALSPDRGRPAGTASPEPAASPPGGSAASMPLPFPAGPGAGTRILQGALVVLAWVVAGGFALIVLPEKTVDSWAEALRLRAASPTVLQEPLALLYLGDEIAAKEFHIRGVVRNISPQPIEKLDAVIRLYAADGTLVETAIVRMDTETIVADGTATFHLVFRDFQGQFTGYSADFKLRHGEPVRFKDMRAAR